MKTLTDAINLLLPTGRCILIAGSGFSYGANNRDAKPISSTVQLTDLIIMRTDVPKEQRSQFDLRSAMDAYLEKNPDQSKLAQLLHHHLFAKTIAPHHKILAALPWYRIYTTNYDNVIEVSLDTQDIPPPDVFDQSGHVVHRKKGVLQVVHLHGYIAATNPKDEPSRFIAGVKSYAEPSLYESPWLKQLERDVENAPAVFVVGHSISDNHLARILLRKPHLTSKIFLIIEPSPPLALTYSVKPFGEVFNIGVDGFANLCGTIPKTPIREAVTPHALEQLEFQAAKQETTARDVEDLFLKGRMDLGLTFRQLQKAHAVTYFVERASDHIEWLRQGKRIFFVHSDIGNGKTVYINELGARLAQAGWHVSRLHPERGNIDDVVNFYTQRTTNDAIIVEDVFQYEGLITELMNLPRTNILWILGTRSAAFELRFAHIQRDYHSRYVEIDLNRLSDDSLSNFSKLLDQFGYWRDRASWGLSDKIRHLSSKCHSEVRGILLSLLDSPAIKSRLDQYFAAIKKLPHRLSEFVALSAYTRMISGTEMDAYTIGSIMEYDYSNEIFSYRRTLDREIFSPDGFAQFRSPVFGEYYLREYIDDATTLEQISRFVVALDGYSKHERGYKAVLRQALRYRFIRAIMNSSLADDLVDKFFERLHSLDIARTDPLFWVQASIAKSANGHFSSCENYIQTARSYARKNPNYDQYQIDTHEAKFLIESRLAGYKSDYGAALIQSARLVIGVITRREEDLVLPLDIVSEYPEFYARFREKIDESDTSQMRMLLGEIRNRIDKYSAVILARKNVGARANAAINTIMNQSEGYY